MEGWAILGLVLFSAALHCTLQSLRLRRGVVPALAPPNDLPAQATIHSRRPIFLSRRDDLL